MSFSSEDSGFNTHRKYQGSYVKVSTSEGLRQMNLSSSGSPSTIKSMTINDKSTPVGFQINLSDTSSGYNSTSFLPSLQHHSAHKSHPVYMFKFPSSSGNFVRKAINEKPTRLKYLKDSVTSILDQIDTRVSFLRETALELEEEKFKLLGVLNSLISTQDLSLISEVDKEEIILTANHLLQRLHSVNVQISIPRNNEQKQALTIINNYIEKLILIHKTNVKEANNLCQLYLNTCSPDYNNLPVDDQFQTSVIACTAEDQKKIRKKLEALKSTFDHTDQ